MSVGQADNHLLSKMVDWAASRSAALSFCYNIVMQLKLARTGESINLHISTISLVPTDAVSLFRCVVCGTAISQYEGSVVKIYPFVEPDDAVLTINKCPGCGALYTFQSQNGTKKDTKVVLFNDPYISNDNHFRCYLCRTDLLRFTYDKIVNLINLSLSELPFSLKCPTFDCPATFNFVDLV
jgi:hypothetical protein